jgi:hypothetical protein
MVCEIDILNKISVDINYMYITNFISEKNRKEMKELNEDEGLNV